MTTASKFKRLSFAIIAGGLLFGVSPAGAQEAPAESPPPATATASPTGPTQMPGTSSSSLTPEGEAEGLGIKVDLDTQPRPDSFGKNFVPLIVTVTKNGAPTTVDYDVFANAENADGEVALTEPCLERWYTSTTTPRGVFWCTVVVDSPAQWTFFSFVNKRQGSAGAEAAEAESTRGPDFVVLNYGQAQVGIECLEANGCITLESKGKVKQVSGDASSVGFLSIHSIFAYGWFVCIGLLFLLSLAGGRQFLSERGRHLLESQLDRIITGAKATTLAVTATGIYLMFRETAYSTPSTPDKLEAVFKLPFGRPYYLSLFTKITIYAVLVGFSFVLMREARRRSTTVLDTGGRRKAGGRNVSVDDIWGADNWEKSTPAGRGGTAVMVDEPQVIVEEGSDLEVTADPTRKGVRVAFLATALGGVGIFMCIVLLKYFHQLIEAAFATSTLAGG